MHIPELLHRSVTHELFFSHNITLTSALLNKYRCKMWYTKCLASFALIYKKKFESSHLS